MAMPPAAVGLHRALFCLFILLAAAVADAAARSDPPATPPPKAEPAPKPPGAEALKLPPLKTVCVIISDAGLRHSLFGGAAATAAATATGQTADGKCLDLRKGTGLLSGSGDLTIVVDQKNLETFRQAKQERPGSFILFLNGVPMLSDARLIASESDGAQVAFRYRISQGKESQLLWSMLYADAGPFQSQPLYAALGWKADSETSPSFIPAREQTGAQVRVTTEMQLVLALLLVVLTVGAVIYIGACSDSLRDANLPAWWLDAATLKATMAKMDAPARSTYLGTAYPWYLPANEAQYQQRAELLLKGQPVAEAEVGPVTVGLALLPQNWRPLRATFSLSRTQLALWFTFTVGAGLFLWMLYGDLRRIDGSLLTLLGISVGTAGVSWVTDRNMPERPYLPSQGFLNDLLTGFDERKQLHRYQAVIINLLLLVVGIFHVGQQLSYPVFDPSWLIFLGISGSAYGLGKGLIETGK